MRDYRLTNEIYCNMCSRQMSGDELDTLETVFVNGKNALTICAECYEEVEFDFKTCPHCDAQVHMDEIADSGTCPCCGFVEQEHTGSSWI